MTYPNPNRQVPGYVQPYPPFGHQSGRDHTPAPPGDDGLGWWTATVLTLCGIVARPDRLQKSSKQAVLVLTVGVLAFLAVFGTWAIYTFITHR